MSQMRFHNTKQLTFKLLLLFQFLFLISAGKAWAQSLSDYVSVPPLSVENRSEPMIMLTLSNDHQLFFEAYSGYEDYDNDGSIDLSYNHNVQYDGYFDPKKCYSYQDGQSDSFAPSATEPYEEGDFAYCNEPQKDAEGNVLTDAQGKNLYSSELWSGNFLNWATMTRMDLVRFVLYGGFRSTDTENQTVLERAYLPNDGHSFVKYYSGSDIRKLTAHYLDEISICNTTKHHEGDVNSADSALSQDMFVRDLPPLMRVVGGNYSMWAGQDRYQCLLGNVYPGTPQVDSANREYPVWG